MLNMGHNGHGINLYGVITIRMSNEHAYGDILTGGLSVLVHRYVVPPMILVIMTLPQWSRGQLRHGSLISSAECDAHNDPDGTPTTWNETPLELTDTVANIYVINATTLR